ncbi:MAG: YjgP/YjgQ family permease [Flammeovirgaceae bacterium TMED290]|nr:MAG: YjgP/YjgQ family permease [Flammeovirgaceae bacterium TMED290]
MSILDKYIFRKFLTTFLFVVAIMIVVVVVIDFTEKNDKFIKNNVSYIDILNYYYSFIPYIISLVTPITAFIATVYVTSQLANRTEIIPILSSGNSYLSIIKPFFYGSIIIAIISFSLNAFIIPYLNKERISFELMYIKSPFYFSDKNIHFKIDDQTYLYLERYDNNMDIGYNVTIENFNNLKLKNKLFAKQLIWDKELKNWKFKSWEKRILNNDGEVIIDGIDFDTTLLISPSDFDNKYGLSETLTLSELNEFIELQILRGSDDVKLYYIEKFIRYAQPFTVMILVVLGVIIAIKKSRQGTGYLIAIGFSLAFLFITFFVMTRAFAENGGLDPLLAVWAPNIVFGLLTFYLYKIVLD